MLFLFNKYLVCGMKGEASRAWHERKLIVLHKKKKKMNENFDVVEHSRKLKSRAVKGGKILIRIRIEIKTEDIGLDSRDVQKPGDRHWTSHLHKVMGVNPFYADLQGLFS